MPGLFKPKGPVANQLTTEAVPNTLGWAPRDAAESESETGVTFDLDLAPPVVQEELDEATPEAPDDDAETAEAPRVRTPAELKAELDREAEEFFGPTGTATSDPVESSDAIDPIERYGPYGEDVEAVMVALDDVRFDDITSDDLRRLADEWKSVDPEAAAAVQTVIERYRAEGPYVDFLETAYVDLDHWQPNRQTTGKDAELDRVVVEAARDAIDALILQDELDDDQFDLLYGPWADVIDPIEEAGFSGDATHTAVAGGTEGSAAPDEGFGPNAAAVRAFLATLAELGADDFKSLTAAFNRQPKAELKRAHDAVHDLVDTDRTRRDRVVAAQDWVTSYLRPTREMVEGPVTDLRISRSAPSVDRLVVDKGMALPPAIDAVTALVLGDLLHPEDAETLLAPWTRMMDGADTDEF